MVTDRIGFSLMGRVTERRRTLRIRDGAVSSRADTLVAEEPLEIRLNGKPLAITMRTPATTSRWPPGSWSARA